MGKGIALTAAIVMTKAAALEHRLISLSTLMIRFTLATVYISILLGAIEMMKREEAHVGAGPVP
jgi:hypothetical protein